MQRGGEQTPSSHLLLSCAARGAWMPYINSSLAQNYWYAANESLAENRKLSSSYPTLLAEIHSMSFAAFHINYWQQWDFSGILWKWFLKPGTETLKSIKYWCCSNSTVLTGLTVGTSSLPWFYFNVRRVTQTTQFSTSICHFQTRRKVILFSSDHNLS